MKTYIYTILTACLVFAGCISLHRDSTAAVLRRIVIPRLGFRQANAADVVVFFQSVYEEYRQSGDPELRFVADAQLGTMTIGGPMKDDPQSMRIDEGMTASASLWDEMQRFAELGSLSIRIEGQTVTFRSKQEAANIRVDHISEVQ